MLFIRVIAEYFDQDGRIWQRLLIVVSKLRFTTINDDIRVGKTGALVPGAWMALCFLWRGLATPHRGRSFTRLWER